MEKERFQQDINAQFYKIEKAQGTFSAALNNVKQVKGDQFEESAQNLEVMAILE